MPDQAFVGARGVKVFISSIPGQARPGWKGQVEEEEEKREVYERHEKLRAHLETCLAPLQRAAQLTLWHDGKVRGGKMWEQGITDHLENAQIILLLLSPEFFSSSFCCAQMEQALSQQVKGVPVIPIYLSPIVNREDFPVGALQSLPGHGSSISEAPDVDAAWSKIAADLYVIIRELDPQSLPSQASAAQQPVHRNLLLKRPPVPFSTALLPRTHLVESMYQQLLQAATTTGLILTGLSGTGKTTLAALVYYYAEQQRQAGLGPFTQAPLWFDLEPTTTLVDVIYSLCLALGQPMPAVFGMTTGELAEALYTLLECAERLVVFDHFENWLDPQSGQARPEYAGAGEWLVLLSAGNIGSAGFSGRVLLTSHFYPYRLFQYGDASYVQHYVAPQLEMAEGIQLLRMDRVPAILQAPDKELTRLVERCQGHPQTLVWLRQLCSRDSGLRVTDFLPDQRAEDKLVGGALLQTLNVIYTKQLKPGQRALIQAFETFREAVPLEAALAVASPQRRNSGKRSVDLPLVLLDLGLLQAFESGYYRLHPLVADFVRQKISHRVHCTAHFNAASYYQQQFEYLSTRDGSVMPTGEDFHHIVEAVWHLCQADQRDEAYHLMQKTALFKHLYRQGYAGTLLVIYLELLAEPDWQPEPSRAAYMYNELGEIRDALGQKSEALRDYQRALALFRQTGEREGIVEALNNLGAIHSALRDDRQAQESYQEALRICEETPHRLIQQGTTLNNLGRLAYDRGDQARQNRNLAQARTRYREALTYYEQALVSYQASELFDEEAIALNHLGDACQALGIREQAQIRYQQALTRFQTLGDRRGEALSLNNLGRLYQNMVSEGTAHDYPAEARACYEQALRLFRATGDRWQESITLGNLGRFYPIYQNLEEYERYQRSLACLTLADQIASALHRRQRVQIPGWIEETLRRWLASSGEQSYEAFLRDVAARAEEIMQEVVEGS